MKEKKRSVRGEEREMRQHPRGVSSPVPRLFVLFYFFSFSFSPSFFSCNSRIDERLQAWVTQRVCGGGGHAPVRSPSPSASPPSSPAAPPPPPPALPATTRR